MKTSRRSKISSSVARPARTSTVAASALLASMQTKDTTTANGALSNSSSGSHVLDFFGKAGALRSSGDAEAVKWFVSAYQADREMALKVLFWAGDIRGGQGERRLFRLCFCWLAIHATAVAKKLLPLIPEYRRWDDVLESTNGTPLERDGIMLLINQLLLDEKVQAPSLAAKWAPSLNASSKVTRELAEKVRATADLTPRNYRRLLSGLREKIRIVERFMCANEWDKIEYERVPSQAARIYKDAFSKHSPERYAAYLSAVEKGEAKINAGVLYPYDITRDLMRQPGGTPAARTLEAQWKALPDYLADNPHNGLVVADVSGSMMGQPLEVCLSLAIYFAERNVGLFRDHFLTFSDDSKLQRLVGATLKEKITNLSHAGWGMSTNLQSAFQSILSAATRAKVSAKEMPKAIYIISDMQFNVAVADNSLTNLESIKAQYKSAGYTLPKIVFWCVNAHADSPVTVNDKGVCLVSGCSPSILKTVLSGKIVTPLDVMKQTVCVERYAAITV